jgi:hypothetical protein
MTPMASVGDGFQAGAEGGFDHLLASGAVVAFVLVGHWPPTVT